MTVDPRSLIYPAHDESDDRDGATRAGLEQQRRPAEGEERRTGTNDELRELDRAERRKKE
jgi:hypothetical protein